MPNYNQMPKEEGLDHSLDLLREGYLFIQNRRRSFQSDVFETRLLGEKAICMGGEEAAELFYDHDKFKRKGAAPKRVLKTLFGETGVQTLDEQEHRSRKAMFMSIMSEEGLERLKKILNKYWRLAIDIWSRMDKVVLYDEAQEIMIKTACEWAGVPLKTEEVKKRAKEMTAMIESGAAIGPSHWKGRYERSQAQKWIQELVEEVRAGKLTPPEDTALYVFAWHKEINGNLMESETAAIEVINILRPIVAISVYITFTALALHQHPEERKKLKAGDDDAKQRFVQEVRRFYPFFPFVAARVKEDFIWNDFSFEKDALVLLDLYSTNHDPKIWDNPELFNPERFRNWKGSPFNFIPQGGGDYLGGHRCAGEWVTIQAMIVSLDYLANQLDYTVPDQDTGYSMVSMPSLPNSGFIIQVQ
ncbi:cytochrome P450 [Bacillus xiapuensis]|uniref:cytochrome P450 n=1 Tax=Bacillus xiapuensis TaxID=2014075 RepID=UPI000C24C764|nr:cytochrome P450 [Bacillus xiapuensis]